MEHINDLKIRLMVRDVVAFNDIYREHLNPAKLRASISHVVW